MIRYLWLLLALPACTGPDGSARSFEVPPRDTFAPVGELLHARCGSLDCHGQVGRNLRIYGKNGLRLAASDVPGLDGGVTTDPELDANYASVVGLEPELLAQVTREGGAHPERLTLIRKARGEENHKGGTILAKGGLADRCLVGWLGTGNADATLCADGTKIALPPGF